MSDTPSELPFDPIGIAPDDRPRPATGGTGILTGAQTLALAQSSFDAGQDPAAIKAALAADGIEWEPDTRTKAERAWSEDFQTGRPERYRIDGLDRQFADAQPGEVDALGDVIRSFVAGVGLDRSGGSELAETIVKTMAQLRGARPEARIQYQYDQRARLGDKADAQVADATKSLQGVSPDVLSVLHRSGALDNADVVFALASMHRARAARG